MIGWRNGVTENLANNQTSISGEHLAIFERDIVEIVLTALHSSDQRYNFEDRITTSVAMAIVFLSNRYLFILYH